MKPQIQHTISKSVFVVLWTKVKSSMFSLPLLCLFPPKMKSCYSSVFFPQILNRGECSHYKAINLDLSDWEKSIVMCQPQSQGNKIFIVVITSSSIWFTQLIPLSLLFLTFSQLFRSFLQNSVFSLMAPFKLGVQAPLWSQHTMLSHNGGHREFAESFSKVHAQCDNDHGPHVGDKSN